MTNLCTGAHRNHLQTHLSCYKTAPFHLCWDSIALHVLFVWFRELDVACFSLTPCETTSSFHWMHWHSSENNCWQVWPCWCCNEWGKHCMLWTKHALKRIWTLRILASILHFWSVAHFNKTVFKGGSPKLGESQALGESLRLSPIMGESLKLSPKSGESFRAESFNMKELWHIFTYVRNSPLK